jgi:hypothetical protein
MTPYPQWLYVVSWISLGVSVACALAIVVDVFRRPQQMAIMDVVWPMTALYWGPAALWAYFRVGTRTTRQHHHDMMKSMSHDQMEHAKEELKSEPLTRTQAAVGDSHCGAGCTLGDIVGEALVAGTGLLLFGGLLATRLVVDFVFAWAFGVVLQYFTIAPMRHLPVGKGIVAAIKADTVSILAFQIGMSFWALLTYYVLFPAPHLEVADPVFWFMMQIGMILGYFTSYPANVWLLERGLKEKMPDMPDAAHALDRALHQQ